MLSMVSRKCGSKAFLKEAGEATRGDMQRKRNTESWLWEGARARLHPTRKLVPHYR